LHFWASWCEPCLDEIPELYRFAEKFDSNEFAMVAVSLDKTWEEAKEVTRLEGLPPTITLLLDPTLVSAKKYGSFQFPETFLISKSGKILTKWIGPQKWGTPFFESRVKQAFSQ